MTDNNKLSGGKETELKDGKEELDVRLEEVENDPEFREQRMNIVNIFAKDRPVDYDLLLYSYEEVIKRMKGEFLDYIDKAEFEPCKSIIAKLTRFTMKIALKPHRSIQELFGMKIKVEMPISKELENALLDSSVNEKDIEIDREYCFVNKNNKVKVEDIDESFTDEVLKVIFAMLSELDNIHLDIENKKIIYEGTLYPTERALLNISDFREEGCIIEPVMKENVR